MRLLLERPCGQSVSEGRVKSGKLCIEYRKHSKLEELIEAYRQVVNGATKGRLFSFFRGNPNMNYQCRHIPPQACRR